MSESSHAVIDTLLQALMDKDLKVSLAYFADDALVYDPRYPISIMKGKT